MDYYLSDKLGSASVVTDANGVKVDDCDYLPYGQTNCITSSSGNHYLYTGLERDADQLDHTLHRQYSSSLGRWMSPDPGGVKVVNMDTPETWNMYAYVADNPTTDTDPTGLSSQYNTNGGCATLRNCNDDRKSLDHPPGQELNSGTTTNQANMLTNTTQSQVVALVCAEACTSTKAGQEAVTSAILNRANSGEKQYVAPDKTVNVTNVVESGQFQGIKLPIYKQALAGKLNNTAGFKSAQAAVGHVLKHGVTTNATFIFHGKSPPPSNTWMGRAVRNKTLVPATPAKVDDWWLYVPR